jgi:uncharacterized membrane protein YphA (DoxX/SURF4 family)
MLERLFYGLIVIVVGVLLLKFNFQLVNDWTGRLDWVENKLGAGSTYLFYKLLAVLLVLGGILHISGLLDNVASWLLSPLTGLFKI